MTEARKQELITIAAEIRQKHHLGAVAPIQDIFKLCYKKYKVKIQFFRFCEIKEFYHYRNKDTMARINPQTKKLQVLINQDHCHTITWVRFMVAYEFAHYLLGVYEKNPKLHRCDNVNLFIQQPDIAEANFLAAELLIPGVALEGKIDVQNVARYYRVTELVVQYRKSML